MGAYCFSIYFSFYSLAFEANTCIQSFIEFSKSMTAVKNEVKNYLQSYFEFPDDRILNVYPLSNEY